MKTLQNNFTTIEQSKRLLELGVPADSADMYYQNALPEPKVIPVGRKFQEYTNSIEGAMRHIWYFIPCWSVGRLMEIYKIVGEEAGQCISCSKAQTQVESLVQLYEENIGLLDFSKLE